MRLTLPRVAAAQSGAGLLTTGMADAALSSLAGFAASFYAARFLDTEVLGAYALFLSASMVAGLLPQQLLFLPSQLAALNAPPAARVALLRPTLLPGFGLSWMAAFLITVPVFVLGGRVNATELVALASGACLLVLVSPLQDHIRSTLHLAGRAPAAAALSGVQLALTLTALGAFQVSGAGPVWVPFLALAVGVAGSAAFGWRAASPGATIVLPPTRSLFNSGVLLLPGALVQELSLFVASALLAGIASPSALGQVEAGRVVARPVQVLSLGISRALAPALMEAGRRREGSAAGTAASFYSSAVLVASAPYVVVAGFDHALNPVARLLPVAYEVEGLTALVLLATVAGVLSQLPRALLLGGGRERPLLWLTLLGAGMRLLVVASSATALGAYALPLAQLAFAAVVGLLGLLATRRLLGK